MLNDLRNSCSNTSSTPPHISSCRSALLQALVISCSCGVCLLLVTISPSRQTAARPGIATRHRSSGWSWSPAGRQWEWEQWEPGRHNNPSSHLPASRGAEWRLCRCTRLQPVGFTAALSAQIHCPQFALERRLAVTLRAGLEFPRQPRYRATPRPG